MSDEQVKEFIPRYGDRIAVVAFARKMSRKRRGPEGEEGSERKQNLIDKLSKKLDKQQHQHFTRSKGQLGNTNAKRKERRVEIGWIDYDFKSQEYKQVKSPAGGGIKHECFGVNQTLSSILEEIIEWFFPNGSSRRGRVENFHFFITDATHEPIDGDITVSEMYAKGKFTILRLYLASKKKASEAKVVLPDLNPMPAPQPQYDIVKKEAKKRIGKRPSSSATSQTDPSGPHCREEKGQCADLAAGSSIYSSRSTQDESEKTGGLPTERPSGAFEVNSEPCTSGAFEVNTEPCTSNMYYVVTESEAVSLNFGQYTVTGDAVPQEMEQTLPYQCDFPGVSTPSLPDLTSDTECLPAMSPVTLSPDTALSEPSKENDIPLPLNVISTPKNTPTNTSTPPRQEPPSNMPRNASIPPHEEIPPRSPTPPPETPPVRNATIVGLHRSRIQDEILSLFMDPSIITMNIKIQFIDEKGSDAQGVSRDAYSAFWKEFFSTSACGEDERVPSIFPEYGQDEWQAVGRILLKGYTDCGIYPLQLSQAFSVAVIHGELNVSSDMLVESFRMYLSETDRKVVDKALSGQVLDEDDQDDFLDLLSHVDCKSIPKAEEMRHTVLRMAHKELIQEPKYALDAIAGAARDQLQLLLPDVQTVQEMYNSKTPTVRKVIKLLDCAPINKEQTDALGYLKQFIKGLDGGMLRKFLRHFTGADHICTPKIEVSFNRMSGFGRVPMAHTCGPLIELPSTYSSYPELRREFLTILDANYLNMDIA